MRQLTTTTLEVTRSCIEEKITSRRGMAYEGHLGQLITALELTDE